MLAIRLQRTGRSGHAQFRVIVQDARLSPKSGKVVAILGSYNPHAKTVSIDKDQAVYYLEHGAQPSDRVVSLLKQEGVKLPKWVAKPDKKDGKIKNPEKLRKNRPASAEAPADQPAEPEAPAEMAAEEAQADENEHVLEAIEPSTESETPAENDIETSETETQAEAEADPVSTESAETETPTEPTSRPEAAEK